MSTETAAIFDALAETITKPADAIAAAKARSIYDRARNMSGERSEQAREAITDASWNLSDALEFYRLILDGQVHPLSAYGWLTYQPEDRRYERALQMAAEDAASEAAELVRVIREHCGEQAAAFVSGTEGGE